MGACTHPAAIITELMDGDVWQLISSRTQISLIQRMNMAEDTARGMAYLHNAKLAGGAIIHRDLKPENMFYKRLGDRYHIKIGDFGFSEVQPVQRKCQDAGGKIKASLMYAAPEVLQALPFDSATDVYSFGIILWILYEWKLPYAHHKSKEEFQMSILKNERPPISAGTPEALGQLMTRCWSPNPADRPTFLEIVEELKKLLRQLHGVDIFKLVLQDRHGMEFWCKYFETERVVPWATFKNKLDEYLGTIPVTTPIESMETDSSEADTLGADKLRITDACVKSLFAEKRGNEFVVDIVRFGKMLKWVGPLRGRNPPRQSLFEGIYNLLSAEWFHGLLDKTEAEARLQGRPDCFLVRFSTSTAGTYTLSCSQASQSGVCHSVMHYRILYDHAKGYYSHNAFYATLSEVVIALSKIFSLNKPCPGSAYQKLWDSSDSSSTYVELLQPVSFSH
eukprot:TRINITY_DN1286_c0_g2_i1.p1 TRINITY_DN1286_c0_g2~~TRINITY_DN1286_c0_g2_i1.p1  ORF type:complete len:514 (+),score=29.87 TRINITY_DN1286_c0_g2_i1:194-1543(+)